MKSTKQHQTTPNGINDDAEGWASECRGAAKAEVAHGEWLPMLAEIGIAEAEARRLMAIARRFSNRSYENDLPAARRGAEHGAL